MDKENKGIEAPQLVEIRRWVEKVQSVAGSINANVAELRDQLGVTSLNMAHPTIKAFIGGYRIYLNEELNSAERDLLRYSSFVCDTASLSHLINDTRLYLNLIGLHDIPRVGLVGR